MRHTGTQTIATERLTLRRFTIEDAENMYYNWASDPEDVYKRQLLLCQKRYFREVLPVWQHSSGKKITFFRKNLKRAVPVLRVLFLFRFHHKSEHLHLSETVFLFAF